MRKGRHTRAGTGTGTSGARPRLGRAVAAWRAGAYHLLEGLEQRLVLDSTVVFNELMYNPPGVGAASDSLEWVELHNQMAVDVDLSGWRLNNGVDFTFPEGTIIKGGKDLVVAANPTALQAATPGLTGILGP